MASRRMLGVFYKNERVGTLALMEQKKTAFEYSDEWIQNGFSISPFSLPLEKRVFVPTKSCFGGLFGVFADSLPDAWGNILLNRLLKKHGISQDELTILDRLAIVGSAGMGALSYRPEISLTNVEKKLDLDKLASQCQQILVSAHAEDLDELYQLGGTSGGARPKIMTKIESEEWIIKFPAHVDGIDSGQMEYDYSLCAKLCGINMPETKLFPSKNCEGYFGIKRFDRVRNKTGQEERIHMCTVAALLEIDFTQPSLDYYELMKLVKILTRDYSVDVEDMYRRMCFNVFAHNRDDHAKNFSYLYDVKNDRWRLSPGYDITYSNTYYGEHTTSVNGNGSSPGKKDLCQVGVKSGMKRKCCEEIIEEVHSCVEEQLERYL